jgi:tryptophan-rich sensory protein
MVWTGIYFLAAVSALVVWNSKNLTPGDSLFGYLAIFFAANVVMNIFWSYLFFVMHMIQWAALEAVALALSILALILYIWPISTFAALLLVPYLIWVCFAAYLNYTIWKLNSK